MTSLAVKIDAAPLIAWASELSASKLRLALRRAVDQSAREARRVTIDTISKDIGVAPSKIRDATPLVKTTTAGSLVASWTVSKMRIGIKNVAGASITKKGGLVASTHRLGGGGSSSLKLKHAFLVKTKSGGVFVAYRRGKARLPLKAVWAEHPATALGQNGSPAQKIWIETADREVKMRLGAQIQKALSG